MIRAVHGSNRTLRQCRKIKTYVEGLDRPEEVARITCGDLVHGADLYAVRRIANMSSTWQPLHSARSRDSQSVGEGQ